MGALKNQLIRELDSEMRERRGYPTVCDAFVQWAHEAVYEWDGQDNGDLLVLLAHHFVMPLAALIAAGQAVVERDARLIASLDDPSSIDRNGTDNLNGTEF